MSKKVRHTYEYVLNFVKENSECELISKEYVNAHEKLKFKCKCGEYFETDFNHFQNQKKRQCKKCGNKLRNRNNVLNIEEIKRFVEENSESKLISNIYENVRQQLLFKCSCGKTFSTTFDGFKWRKVRRCRTCASSVSNMELEISNILSNKGIKYIPQYKFEKCKDNKFLPFDFYLPEFNTCIEADGRQHFEEVCFGDMNIEQAKENFLIIKRHDKIKNDFCKENNIKLIRIPYFEKNIKSIIESIV